ncbi:MAG TPA: glycoside hydrolase family 3 N-terminal domain-containing protein [Flavipsychrobacter sp.]|nr:glycoside hydrolase family 3 N-terminal domain-containing protein [Flavipsychrobacter sp.]
MPQSIVRTLIITLATCLPVLSFGQTSITSSSPDFFKNKWVEDTYNKLSLDEKIGQLFMVAAYSGGPNYNEDAITKLIQNKQIGGVIFMQGDAVKQGTQTNKYQQLANVPLLIAMDAEWGLGMRLTGVKDMPRQMLLGATRDTELVYKMGAAIAAQCNRLGVHIDFAPVVDVNNNPKNPVINARSFGENKYNVSRLAIAYMRGLQDNGVMACAKHFPGHGDTDADSHKDLPVINKSLAQLDTLEFFPFKQLIAAGVKSVMAAHLEVPSLETGVHIPTSLSRNTLTNTLKGKMGFNGLVFTDALDMKGVAKYFEPGEVDVRAFKAGNDVLLFSQNVPVAIEKIKAALNTGDIQQVQLETSVKKILAAKYDAGLSQFKPIDITNITNDLNKDVKAIREEAAAKGITLVRDNSSLLGKITGTDSRIQYIGVNASGSTALLTTLQEGKPTIRFSFLPKGSSAAQVAKLQQSTEDNDVTIIAIHNMSFYPTNGNYGLDAQQMDFLKSMEKQPNVIYALMGNAYLLKNFCDAGSVMVSYEDNEDVENVMAKILLRQLNPKGKLPVTPCSNMAAAPPVLAAGVTGKPAQKVNTLQKVEFPVDAGFVNPEVIDKLNMFIQRNIVDGAFPGCRILAAKDGRIIYDEAFGYYTYSKTKPVTLNTMYDVASLTKVLATNLAVMRLYEQGKLDLNKRLGDYLPWVKGTNKEFLTIKNLLLHQAGLKSWIPFYKETLDSTGQLREDLYTTQPKSDYKIPVAKNLYLRNDWADTIWNRILQSPLENIGKYVYSDLDFYFLSAVVERITKRQLNVYMEEQFYKPLGLTHTSFNPLKKFTTEDIAPTESDYGFRQQLLQGYVHDPGAAMFGGVAGHAGIFSTAQDVAVIFQMLLNGGSYNGKQYFKPATLNKFTAYNATISRRGLGFDKPNANNDDAGPTGNRVSGYAFGHQGFTGTCAWADPASGIVFVFLSNRIYPSQDNNNINRKSTRTVAQDYIYEAFDIKDNKQRASLYKQQIK